MYVHIGTESLYEHVLIAYVLPDGSISTIIRCHRVTSRCGLVQ